MADQDDKKPTEEQVKAANAAEEAKWEGDYTEEDLKIPYKREDGDADKGDKAAKEGGVTGGDNGGDDQSGDEDDNKQAQEVTTYTEPTTVVTVEDPGEYKPADYSFDAALANGKTVKITTPEEADRLSEDSDNFDTPKQLLDFIKKSTKMQNQLDRDEANWKTQKEAFDTQSETESQRIETVNNVANEIEYLVGKGKLPKVAPEYASADWSDPNVAKQAGVKEQLALIEYMMKENDARQKAGLKPAGPLDAFSAMQNDEAEQAKVDAAKQAGERRKANGARVASVSASQQGTYAPKGIAVGNPNVFKRNQAIWD